MASDPAALNRTGHNGSSSVWVFEGVQGGVGVVGNGLALTERVQLDVTDGDDPVGSLYFKPSAL